MDFGLTEEQQLLQQTIAGFLQNECPPLRVREIFESDDGFDETLWKGMVELGLGGLAIPEEYGGAGLEILDLALVAETLGAGAAPGPFLGHVLAGIAITAGGSDEQKQRWLPKLATGDLLGSVALAGEGEGWLPEEWTLAGGKALTGRKRFVPYAGRADLIVVGTAGGGLAVVGARRLGPRGRPVRGRGPHAPPGRGGVQRDAGRAPRSGERCGRAPARRGPGAARGRCPRRREPLRGDGRGVRQDARAVRREDRELPGREAPARRHGRRGGAVPGPGLVRGARPRSRPRREPAAWRRPPRRTSPIASCRWARDTVEAHGGIGYTWESRRPDLVQAGHVRPGLHGPASRAPGARGEPAGSAKLRAAAGW